MLDILRQNAKSALTYVLFGIIIVVFVVSFGPGSKGCTEGRATSPGWAARVNGESVNGAEFESQYAALFRTYQARAGQAFTRELAEQLGLRKMAMDQLVEKELLLQEGARLGIAVTDGELEKAIIENPSFQVEGRFQKDLYLKAVASVYGTAARFEDRMRRDLLADKVLALMRTTARVSDEEVRQAFESDGDRASLEFVRFPLSQAREEVKPGAEEVKAFQAREADRIAKHYKDNLARFDKKKRVRARHILVRVAEGAPAAQDEAARKKVEGLLERVRKGEDFEKLAKESSDDPGSRERGGDLGTFGPGVMAKPFEDAAFSTPAGGLAGPVRTPFGWHAIQVVQVQEPEVIPLERAAPDLARELLQTDRARALAGKLAADALARLKAGKPLAEQFPAEPDPKARKKGPAAVKLGTLVLRPDETGSFGAGARPNVPRIGPQDDLFADALAATGPGVLPKVYDTPAGPVVARVKDRVRPDPAQFAARRADIEARLRSQREAEIESGWMKALRERAKVQVNEAYIRGEVSAPPVQLD
jgi:peptidyl-prolyl cis-trans isomerase D